MEKGELKKIHLHFICKLCRNRFFMKQLAISLIFLFAAITVWSQKHDIDSLEDQLKGSLPDTTRAKSLLQLAMKYETVDTLKSIQTYKNVIAFTISKKLNYHSGMAYFNQAFILHQNQHYNDALVSLDSALFYFHTSEHPNTLFRIGQVYGQQSNEYRNLGDYKASVETELKSIEIFEKLGKTANLVVAFDNLSGLYKQIREFEKQEFYAMKALEVARKTKSKDDFFKSYFHVAFALTNQNRYKEAKAYIDSAKSNFVPTQTVDVLVSYYLIKGLIEMNLKLLDDSYTSFSDSYRAAIEGKSLYSILQSKMQMARVLTMQKKFSQAKPILEECYKEAFESKDPSQIEIALDYMARYYEESGDYKNGLKYYKEYKEIADSMASAENKQYATDQEVKFETSKKENQIKELEAEKKIQDLNIRQKNTLNYLLAGSSLIAILIAFLSYRTYTQKRRLQQLRINELEAEKQLTATEAVLKGEEQERTRLAKDLHDGLGGMLSGIKYSFNTMKGNLIMTPENAQAFERSMDMLDSSIREMRRVAHNMMPEALVKFGLDTALSDFCNDINQTGALNVRYQSIGMTNAQLDQTTSITIYRIIQELINNSLKHAGAKNAIVQISRIDGTISITVEDDGKGFDTSILNKSKGIGWSNIQNRVEFLKAKLDVQSSPDKGTSVQIDVSI